MLTGIYRHRPILRWFVFFAFLAVPGLVRGDLARLDSAELHIHVTGVDTDKGVVQYGLYNAPEHFPSRKGRIAEGEVKATRDGVKIIIKSLKPGYYAVAAFHDENLNDSFDQGILGIPLENYGFSNDAHGFLDAPAFKDARFRVGGSPTTISITLGR